jgi:RimJ/RimL family protein N-acetyltransferase
MRPIETPLGTVAIRAAREGDRNALRELRLEALSACPIAFGQMPAEIDSINWTDLTTGPRENDIVFLASTGDQIIGMTGIYRGKKIKERHRTGVWGVYIREQWRGRGIIDGLIQSAVQWGTQQGAKIAHLMVTTTNTRAIACYHRCGFRISGVEHASICFDGVMHDEFLMYRWLDGAQ